MKAVVVKTILDLFRRKWVRITLSNLLIGLAGLFTNLWSTDIAAASQGPWYAHLASKYMLGLLVVILLNTWMQTWLEPSSGFRTRADFRETLRREVSDDLVAAMRDVVRGERANFLVRKKSKRS